MIIDYTTNYNTKKPTIHIFTRDSKNKRIYRKVTDFKPYFSIKADVKTKVHTEPDFIPAMDGSELKKIIVNAPQDVPLVRRQFKEIYEADCIYVDKYCIDYPITDDVGDYRIWFFDIESEYQKKWMYGGFIPINCISVYDSYLKSILTLVTNGVRYSEFKHRYDNDGFVWCFKNDKLLLTALLKLLSKHQPDIISGWNLVHYDIRRLIERLDYLNLNSNNLSPIKKVKTMKYRQQEQPILGRICLDMKFAYEKHIATKTVPTKDLDTVCQYELETPKSHYDLEEMNTNVEMRVMHNREDVKLLVDLDNKLGIIDYFIARQRLAGCSFPTTFYRNSFNDFLMRKEKVFRRLTKNQGGDVS